MAVPRTVYLSLSGLLAVLIRPIQTRIPLALHPPRTPRHDRPEILKRGPVVSVQRLQILEVDAAVVTTSIRQSQTPLSTDGLRT